MDAKDFFPTEVRFIKLGEKGKWEYSCIEVDGTIRLGYASNQHQECLENKWDLVREFWLGYRNGNQGAATRDIKQIQAFYELPETTLWVTFYKRKLYWCFADKTVNERLDDSSRIRRVIGKWSCHTLGENPITLHISDLDGRVSKVQGYQGTICEIERSDYLIRKIRGETQPEVRDAKAAFSNLQSHTVKLLHGLWWHDFELLTDLIFVRAGWQRMSVLGKTEKDVEWDMISPVTERRAFIQVKSSANFKTFEASLNAYRSSGEYDEMYFVAHTIADQRILKCQESNVTIVGPEKLAELTINSGLMNWLIKKHE